MEKIKQGILGGFSDIVLGGDDVEVYLGFISENGKDLAFCKTAKEPTASRCGVN